MSLQKQYNILLKEGTFDLTKEEWDELNGLRKEHFNKNIKRGCGDCTKDALRQVGGKLFAEVKKQTFPKHEPPKTEDKSILYGQIGHTIYKNYFTHLAFLIKTTLKGRGISTVVHYNCYQGAYVWALNGVGFKAKGYKADIKQSDYKKITGKGDIYKTDPKEEADLLIFLQGSREELEQVIEVVKPKYIHTHLELDTHRVKIPKLKEGKLYKWGK